MVSKVYIKTTEACNLNCRHCYIGENRRKTAFFNEEKTIAYLKGKIGTGKNVLISFHGGEPFLCSLDKMQKVVQAFPDACFDATSNLLLLNNDILNFIKQNFYTEEIGAPFVKTSWDYLIRFSDAEQENRWKNNVKKLLQEGVCVKVVTCLTTELVRKITPERYVAFIKELGVKHVDFERLTANTTYDKSLIPSYREADIWLAHLYEIVPEDICVGMFENLKQACRGNFLDCRARECMSHTLTINADGTVGGCPNTSVLYWFEDIHGYKNQELHNQLIKKECVRHMQCYSCEYFRICNGDCHQLSWNETECPGMKKLMERIIENDMEGTEKAVVSHQ